VMELYKKKNIGIIMVTHSMEDAAQFAKRMLVVSQGQIIIDGRPGEVFLKEKKRLLEVGMDVPEVYKLADLLRAKGLHLPGEITDAKTLLAEVKKRKGLK
ncbi:MAG: energy-coupling factor ABC transporter ATP-binding protein, partial [Acidaminococcaceae bacterium]|nr:energy-coupling factor ABC transporter ATP-binding protein [Acidaminococcaceae bacterium]